MYSYIKGILTDMDEESIVVETGGIGYHIYTTGQTFRYLPSVGEEVKVYTYLHVIEITEETDVEEILKMALKNMAFL